MKWVIKPINIEQTEAVCNYINTICSRKYHPSEGYYWCLSPYQIVKKDHYCSRQLKPGFTEITYSEFQWITGAIDRVIIDTKDVIITKESLLTRDEGYKFNCQWDYIEYPFKSSSYWCNLAYVPNLPHISFNVFKTIKETQMATETVLQKEIIGYKFLDSYSEYKPVLRSLGIVIDFERDKPHLHAPTWIAKAKEAGILDKWFEPVYEKDFKEGDYVVVLKTLNIELFGGTRLIGTIIKLDNIGKDNHGISALNKGGDYIPLNNKYSINFKNTDFRFATSKEIADYNKIEVGEWKAEFKGDGGVNFGCQYISKETVLALKILLERPFETKIEIQETPITIKILDRILEQI